MFHSDKELFKHIIDEIDFLEAECEKINEEIFLNDNKTKRAFARSIEIIGEAVKNISNDTIVQNPQIKWRNIAGMRDKLIHGYFSVNYKLVWDVAKNIVPKLKNDIQDIMEKNPEIFS
jgi:uncharacterized protein with HEPN domain